MPLTPIKQKRYTATLTQETPTGAPTVIKIFQNTIGTITWTRTEPGDYVGTTTGAPFGNNGENTVISGGFSDLANTAVCGVLNYTTSGLYQAVVEGENTIRILTLDASTLALKEWNDIGGYITIDITIFNP